MAARKRWSQDVTEHSDALTLEQSVFTRSPVEIARSLQRSAEASTRRKSTPFRSAMSMLVFFENRAGKNLSAARRRALDQAKAELRKLYGKPEPRVRSARAPRATHRKRARSEARRPKRKARGA